MLGDENCGMTLTDERLSTDEVMDTNIWKGDTDEFVEMQRGGRRVRMSG